MEHFFISLENVICALYYSIFSSFPKKYWRKYIELYNQYVDTDDYGKQVVLVLFVLPFLFVFFIASYAFMIPLFLLFEIPICIFYLVMLIVVSPAAFIIFPYDKPNYVPEYMDNNFSTKVRNFPKNLIIRIHRLTVGNLQKLADMKLISKVKKNSKTKGNVPVVEENNKTPKPYYIIKLSTIALIYTFIPIAIITLSIQGILLLLWLACSIVSLPIYFIEIMTSIFGDMIKK